MSEQGNVINVPDPEPRRRLYSRADELYVIIEVAAEQLRQDGNKTEQEQLALTSRMEAIQQAVYTILQNDPLLHPEKRQ